MLDFAQAPANLAGTGVGCTLAVIRQDPDFLQKIIFGPTTRHFFNKP
jgi:hypothetical protein